MLREKNLNESGFISRAVGAQYGMAGSLQLRDHPGDVVRLSCERCERVGQYHKENLIAQFGSDIALPDLRHEIAKCERHGKTGDACAVRNAGAVRLF